MDPDQAAPDSELSDDSAPSSGTFDAAVEAELAAMRQTAGVEAPQHGDANGRQSNASDATDSQEQPNPDEQEAAAPDDADGSDAPDTVEIDFDGERFAVPPKLQEAFMLKADYTRKTQEVAQERNVVAQERQTIRQLFNVAGQFQEADSVVRQLGTAINQIQQRTDWVALRQTDPVEFSARVGELQLLERQRGEAMQFAQQARGAYAAYEQQTVRAQVERGHASVKQLMPDFTPDRAKALADYGARSGLRTETLMELNAGFDPAAVALLEKARKWDELQASKPRVANKVAQARPVMRVGAAQSVNRGNSVERAAQQLRRTGSVNDAVAQELALMQRANSRQRRR